MSFSKMLEILKEKNKGKIVLIRIGAFYVGTGEDAVLLHEKLNLKCTCFKSWFSYKCTREVYRKNG